MADGVPAVVGEEADARDVDGNGGDGVVGVLEVLGSEETT